MDGRFASVRVISAHGSGGPCIKLRSVLKGIALKKGSDSTAPGLPSTIIEDVFRKLPCPTSLFRTYVHHVHTRRSIGVIHTTVVGTCLGELGRGGGRGGLSVVLSGRGRGRKCLYKELFTMLSGVRRSTGNVRSVQRHCVGTTSTAPSVIFTAILGLSARRVRGLGPNKRIFCRGLGRRVVSGLSTGKFPPRLGLRSRKQFFIKCCRRHRSLFVGGRGGRVRWWFWGCGIVSRLGGEVSFICVFSMGSNGPGNSPSTNGLPHISTRANVKLIASIYLGHGIHGCMRVTGKLIGNFSVFVGRGTILGALVSGTRSSSRMGGTGSGVRTTHHFVYGGCFSVEAFNTIVSANGGTNRIHNPVRFAFTHSVSPVTMTRRSVAHVTMTARGRTRGRSNNGHAVKHGTAVPCNLCIYRNFVSTGLTRRAKFSRRSLRLF